MTGKARDAHVWQAVGICVFLALAILAAFGQTAHFEFMGYDDPASVSANPVVEQGLSVNAVGWAFTHAQLGNWIPLTTLSHMLDCQVFGLHAGGHHLVNVLWHAANAVLLFLVLRQMTGGLWRSAFVAALFAVHPLRAESVAWVSERKDVLSGFFFLLAIGAYVRYAEESKMQNAKCKIYYALALVSFVLGLLAKSMVATLPFVLLVLDYWPLGRMRGIQNSEFRIQNKERGEPSPPSLPFWQLVKEKLPLFALSAASCLVAALVPGLVVMAAHRVPLLERLGNAVVSYVVYLGQTVCPVGLAIPYPILPSGQPPWKVCLALVLLAAITAGVVAWRKKRPWLLAGWLWYLGMLFPVIGIIQISQDAAHADRYTYLPGIGLALAGTWAVADWSAGWKHRRLALGGLMIAVTGALTVCARIQTSYWKDSESLWTRAQACTSGNAEALDNLGHVFAQQGKLDKAIVQFRKALEIAPDFADAHNNLGLALVATGNGDEAIAQFRKALENDPDFAEARNDLGSALSAKGNLDEAIVQFRKALEIMPDSAAACYNLASALARKGNLEEAIAQYRAALKLNPGFVEARYYLCKALLRTGDMDGAMARFEEKPGMSPDPVVRWNNFGKDFEQREDWEEAIMCYRQAIKINARSADAFANLGMACLKKGATKQAIDAWQEALAINPGQINVQNNLAWVLATAPDKSLRNGAQAVALATQASQRSGGANPVMLHTLAVAYAEEGGYGLAAATARRALELALAQKNDALAAALQQEIRLYEANPPPRNAPP
jgi:tetratricopeptide (TPR) repeat protein